jgi:predicted RNase H-like HicB family nuclease
MKKYSIETSLPVSVLREEKRFIAYTPALDISTSGKTKKEAEQRFVEMVQIFIEELAEKGTLDRVLSDLGWKKVQKQWQPPLVVSHELASIRA